MAQTYAYILTPDALGKFIDGIPTRGVPEKLTRAYLRTVGFKSTNHRNIIPVLKFLGFIDAATKPTDLYKHLRDRQKSRQVIAQALREAYAELYATYADAHRKDDEALRNFFRGKTTLGDRAISALVGTFKVLAARADFEAKPPHSAPSVAQPPARPGRAERLPPVASQPALTINIQLQIPATSDSAIYDSLFKALRKYVLDIGSEA